MDLIPGRDERNHVYVATPKNFSSRQGMIKKGWPLFTV